MLAVFSGALSPLTFQSCGRASSLVLNAETARMLRLTIPPTLLALADEVIE